MSVEWPESEILRMVDRPSKTTTTVVEQEREPTPLLYRPDGTPLVPPPRKVGFDTPKNKGR